MATQFAKRALQNLTAFISTKWFTKDFKTLALRIATDYAARNEIHYGLGDLTDGTFATGNLKVTGSAGVCVINGVLKVLPALADQDLMAVSGNVLGAITDAGAAVASGYDSSSADQYVTLLATNSDGDGTYTDTDNSNAKYVAIVSTSDHLTSAEIASAIAASDQNSGSADHAGCKYVMVAQIVGKTSSSDEVTLNRNNVLGA